MDSRERVLRAIDFQPCELVPLWHASFFDGFIRNWHACYPQHSEDPDAYYRSDTAIAIGDESFFPSQSQLIQDDGLYIIQRDGWGRITRSSKTGYFSQTLQYPLADKRNLDHLIFEPAANDLRWKGFYENLSEFNSHRKCIFAKVGGLYIRSHFIRSEADLLVDLLDDPEFCDALFDRVGDHLLQMALAALAKGDLWETGLFVYDDMASTNSPMFSPACFERFLLPRYAKLIRAVQAAGCRHVFFHSDGNIAPLLDLLLEAGFAGFNPLEPRSGLDLIRLRERYGRRAVFFGGICNTVILPGGDRDTIRKHIEPLIELARTGGIVLGAASIGEDIRPEVYDYYMGLLGRPEQKPENGAGI